MPSCFAGCWRKVGAGHPTRARTALGRSSEDAELKAGLPRARSVTEQPGPLKAMVSGKPCGHFFPGTETDGICLQGQLPLCCPWAGTQKRIWSGAMLLLCALLQGLDS